MDLLESHKYSFVVKVFGWLAGSNISLGWSPSGHGDPGQSPLRSSEYRPLFKEGGREKLAYNSLFIKIQRK